MYGNESGLNEVRERILAEHTEMRPLLVKLDAAARRLFASARSAHEDDAEVLHEIREAARVLASRFREHIEMEEVKFVPILRKLDAWGDVRAEKMLQEHAEQRLVLTAIVEDAYLAPDHIELADELRWFVASLTRDMELEEKALAECRDDGFPLEQMVG